MKKYIKLPAILTCLFGLLSFSIFAQLVNPQILPIPCGQTSTFSITLPMLCMNEQYDSAGALPAYQNYIVLPGKVAGMPGCDFSLCPPNQICFSGFIGWNTPAPTPMFNANLNKWCIRGGASTITVACSACLCDPSDSTVFPEGRMSNPELANESQGIALPSVFSSLEIFPSPATNELNVRGALKIEVEKVRIQIYDFDGKKVLGGKGINIYEGVFSKILDVGNLSPGHYLVAIYEGNLLLETRKFVVAK